MDTPEQKRRRGNPALVAGIVVVIVIAVAALLFWFMVRSTGDKPLTIAHVLDNLRELDGQLVTVEGEVSDMYNILGIKFFTLTDDTGEIKIVTERGLPQDGQQIKVNGVVHQVFSIKGIDYTVIYEAVEPAD